MRRVAAAPATSSRVWPATGPGSWARCWSSFTVHTGPKALAICRPMPWLRTRIGTPVPCSETTHIAAREVPSCPIRLNSTRSARLKRSREIVSSWLSSESESNVCSRIATSRSASLTVPSAPSSDMTEALPGARGGGTSGSRSGGIPGLEGRQRIILVGVDGEELIQVEQLDHALDRRGQRGEADPGIRLAELLGQGQQRSDAARGDEAHRGQVEHQILPGIAHRGAAVQQQGSGV